MQPQNISQKIPLQSTRSHAQKLNKAYIKKSLQRIISAAIFCWVSVVCYKEQGVLDYEIAKNLNGKAHTLAAVRIRKQTVQYVLYCDGGYLELVPQSALKIGAGFGI